MDGFLKVFVHERALTAFYSLKNHICFDESFLTKMDSKFAPILQRTNVFQILLHVTCVQVPKVQSDWAPKLQKLNLKTVKSILFQGKIVFHLASKIVLLKSFFNLQNNRSLRKHVLRTRIFFSKSKDHFLAHWHIVKEHFSNFKNFCNKQLETSWKYDM